ncbi:MAG: transcriptional regulator, partial [Actinobacteria bacterium]|nr:transcriptional regulator [Actinomycetota bacterium]
LLDGGEQRALGWLALFNDGFTLEAAEALLGGDAVAATQGLVSQSLLSVREIPEGVRYRMLETVREFGRMKLADGGQDRDARLALRRWAVGYARAYSAPLMGAEQFAAMDALSAEEINLADELRSAIAEADRSAVAQLLATLGMFWTVRGEHARLMVLAEAVADVLGDWQPPPELAEVAGAAIAIVLTNTMIAGGERAGRLQVQLRRITASTSDDMPMPRLVAAMMAYDPADADRSRHRLEELAADPDRRTAVAANQWLGNLRENEGDPAGAIAASERALALVGDEDGPWTRAMLHSVLASLTLHMGRGAAIEHARAALPVMERLGAIDDAIQIRSLLVSCAIAEGRLAEAEAELDQIELIARTGAVLGGLAFGHVGRAELLLARGDYASGLAVYRDCAAEMRAFGFPGIPRTGEEPWALFGTSAALAAHGYYATLAEEEYGRALFRTCRDDAIRVLGAASIDLDYPVVGLSLFGLGAWSLLRKAAPDVDAVRLLVLADRFAYSRVVPTLTWERIAPKAEDAAPGKIAEFEAQYAGKRPAALRTQARRAIAGLPG